METEVGEQQETKEEDPETKEPSPQPNLDSSYRFIEGCKIIPQKKIIPLFFKLEKERAKTHQLQIAKSKGVEEIGHMEEKFKEMDRELCGLRDREAIMKNQLETENAWSRGQLKQRENQLACIASLSLEAIQCRTLAKSYALYLKE